MTNVTLEEFKKGLEREKKRRKAKRDREYFNYMRWSRNRTIRQRKGK